MGVMPNICETLIIIIVLSNSINRCSKITDHAYLFTIANKAELHHMTEDLLVVFSNDNGDKDRDHYDSPDIQEQIQQIKSWLDTVPKFYKEQLAHYEQTLKNREEQLRITKMPIATRDKLLYSKEADEQMLTQLLKQLPLIDTLGLSLEEWLRQLENEQEKK